MLDLAVPTKPKKNDAAALDRTKSRLVQIGEDAMRKALLDALEAADWRLTDAAELLGLNGPTNVLRGIRRLGLSAEYEAARSAGKVRPGIRPRTT